MKAFILTTFISVCAASISVVRPAVSTWSRTACGPPSSAHPETPSGPYTTGLDYPGNDMKPCGSAGCLLGTAASYLDCEAKCNTTSGCVAYTVAPADCSGAKGVLCWLKDHADGSGTPRSCRNSRVVGQPATPQVDLPSKWASEVSADKTPLVAYPRPQMVRGQTKTDLKTFRDEGDISTWTNLNGLWEWEAASDDDDGTHPPINKTLSSSILVPFPVESCLSGVAPNSSGNFVRRMWYRLQFTTASNIDNKKQLLHFGAIDWQSTVYLNGQLLGNHTGGYDGFSYDITDGLLGVGNMNELLVYAFDPTDEGSQPHGKQVISKISDPSGDTYTPSSGIWQTVWVENVPAVYIDELFINQASTTDLEVSASILGGQVASVTFEVIEGGKTIATGSGAPGTAVTITIPNAQLWSTTSPHLYDLRISAGKDSVLSYFGLRTFALGDGPAGKRPLLNGQFTFLAGFLDQSFWSDGLYTAPTDEALAYDIQTVPRFGLNFIRLHEKVNAERWYYHADTLGVVVFQDMVQKMGGATKELIPLFIGDLKAMIHGRKNHPSIVQWTTFNEKDCWEIFNQAPYTVQDIVNMSRQLDPTRLVDTDSGGGANDYHVGDVNDIHSYPEPGDPRPSSTQYAMVGEFGGIGNFVEGKEWVPKGCFGYATVNSPAAGAALYVEMASRIAQRVDHLSVSVFTQTTDVERECDGFLNYDRSDKFNDAEVAAIKKANQIIIQNATNFR